MLPGDTLMASGRSLASLDVHFGYSHLQRADTAGRCVVVIDVLRASTTITTALANGARAVYAVAEPAEARRMARRLGRSETVLGGERHALRIPGFDLGNSPREYAASVVKGKAVVTTTTNGTRALLAGRRGATRLVVGSYVNFSRVLAEICGTLASGGDVAIICAGSDGRFSLEDAACAGRLVRLALRSLARRPGATSRQAPRLNDAARTARLLERPYIRNLPQRFKDADHARTLRRAGFARDLTDCAALDAHPVLPVWVRGRLVLQKD